MRGYITLLLLALVSVVLAAEPPSQYRPLPPLKVQDELEKGWVQKRYEFVPKVLKKYGYDAWIITQREYAEDTVFKSLHSSTTTFSARRRTLFMFHTNPDVPNPLHLIDNQQSLWDTLLETLEKVNPKKIAVNHTGEGRLLLNKLGPKWRKRVSSERAIGVEVVAARVGGEEQLKMYQLMTENVWRMIEEGFKHPYAREGDMLHVDIGITAMNMNTDTQHLGYILRSNETKVPAGLVKGLHDANRLQDFVRERMVPGKTGDEVLQTVFDDMKESELKGLIYSHPIGDYGHSAGALIGMANIQGKVPGGGQNKILEYYWTSVELSGDSYIPEWGARQLVSSYPPDITDFQFPLEEDVYWSEQTKKFEWVYGQQTEFHLVKPKKSAWSNSLFSTLMSSLGWQVARWV
ncbi:hypothetical protein IAR55_005181 [Kwoniella newhampshirensis]|uniref:Peptidase M24 domain-containing protein n=1 Tax=Kwoniella newhampshirensis TaxID=1651941 RepID=A0AAW0YXF1_9TREE